MRYCTVRDLRTRQKVPTAHSVRPVRHRRSTVKPQSHGIVRFLYRAIGCDLAKMRHIGNVCCDLQQRSHTAIGLWRLVVRVVVRSPTIGKRSMGRSVVRLVVANTDHRSIIASDDRSYDQSWCHVTDRMINSWDQRSIAKSIAASCDRSNDQSSRPATDRTNNRGIFDRSPDWSYYQTLSRATNRDSLRVVALPNAMSYDGWHH